MMEIIVGIVLALSLFGNVKQHDRIEKLETKTELLAEIANDNAQQAHIAAEVARENAKVIDDVGADLDQCVGRYKEQQAIFNASQQYTALALETLEGRLADSDLSACRVPDWLVDEVAGDSDGN